MTKFRKNWPLCHICHLKYLQLYVWITAFHSKNQHYSELSFSLYNDLPGILGNILIGACILLWQQDKVLGSIYFMHDKVVDFPKYDHKCKTTITFHVTLSNHKETIHLPSHLFISCVETTHSDLCDFKSTSKIIKILMVGLYL